MALPIPDKAVFTPVMEPPVPFEPELERQRREAAVAIMAGFAGSPNGLAGGLEASAERAIEAADFLLARLRQPTVG